MQSVMYGYRSSKQIRNIGKHMCVIVKLQKFNTSLVYVRIPDITLYMFSKDVNVMGWWPLFQIKILSLSLSLLLK